MKRSIRSICFYLCVLLLFVFASLTVYAETEDPATTLKVELVAQSNTVKENEAATFTIKVTNTTSKVFEDVKVYTSTNDGSFAKRLVVARLEPKKTKELSYSYLVPTGARQMKETIEASARSGLTGKVDITKNVLVTVAAAEQAVARSPLNVNVEVNKLGGRKGETVTFTVKAINNAQNTLKNVVVSREQDAVKYELGTIPSLSSKQTSDFKYTYTITEADCKSGKEIKNIFSATAEGGIVNNASSLNTLSITPLTISEIKLKSTADKQIAAVGDELSYAVDLENTGDIDFDEVSLKFKIGNSDAIEWNAFENESDKRLLKGQKRTVTYKHVLTQKDTENSQACIAKISATGIVLEKEVPLTKEEEEESFVFLENEIKQEFIQNLKKGKSDFETYLLAKLTEKLGNDLDTIETKDKKFLDAANKIIFGEAQTFYNEVKSRVNRAVFTVDKTEIERLEKKQNKVRAEYEKLNRLYMEAHFKESILKYSIDAFTSDASASTIVIVATKKSLHIYSQTISQEASDAWSEVKYVRKDGDSYSFGVNWTSKDRLSHIKFEKEDNVGAFTTLDVENKYNWIEEDEKKYTEIQAIYSIDALKGTLVIEEPRFTYKPKSDAVSTIFINKEYSFDDSYNSVVFFADNIVFLEGA